MEKFDLGPAESVQDAKGQFRRTATTDFLINIGFLNRCHGKAMKIIAAPLLVKQSGCGSALPSRLKIGFDEAAFKFLTALVTVLFTSSKLGARNAFQYREMSRFC